MTDNELFTLVRTIILAGLTARAVPGVWDVVRSNQPTQQGANSEPTVYLFKIGPDQRVGSPGTKYEYDAAGDAINVTENQIYASTFQASALVDESTDPAALTPSDALNVVAAIMQSDDTVAQLHAQGVGIGRVAQVTNPYNTNDRDQFQAGSSFDFVLTYRRGFQTVAPEVTVFEDGITRV